MEESLFPSWMVPGLVIEKRELKSKTSPDWRGYLAKVASLGQTYEILLAAEDFAKVVEGSFYEFAGRFEQQKQQLRFMCTKLRPKVLGGSGK